MNICDHIFTHSLLAMMHVNRIGSWVKNGQIYIFRSAMFYMFTTNTFRDKTWEWWGWLMRMRLKEKPEETNGSTFECDRYHLTLALYLECLAQHVFSLLTTQ